MTGWDKNKVWRDDPLTDVQKTILEELGFQPQWKWRPGGWACGAFSQDNGEMRATPIIVRELPYKPKVNAILRSIGFKWDPHNKEWEGADNTPEQIEVLQALQACGIRVGAYA